MPTVRLRISEKIYDSFIKLLKRFDKSEVEVIPEDESYKNAKKYLNKELEEIKSGQAKFISLEEFDAQVNDLIEKYENRT